MGNRKLRRKVAKAAKEAGLGKLYLGTRRQAFRFMRAEHLRSLLWAINLRKGDLVNDCDCFNHYVDECIFERIGYGQVLTLERVRFEDGKMSCGCPGSPAMPWSNDEIYEFWNEYYTPENIQRIKDLGFWKEWDEKRFKRMHNNQPLCDENGVKLYDKD